MRQAMQFIGMDQDSENRSVQPGSYRRALNLRSADTVGENVGAVENMLGNLPHIVQLGGGFNKAIGYAVDSKRESLILFIYNVPSGQDAQHMIITYKETNEETPAVDDHKILLQGPFLNFDDDNPVKDAFVVDKFLYWNDGVNPPRYLNIEKAINGDYSGITDGDLFNVSKLPPHKTPLVSYFRDPAADDDNSISIAQKLFQFSYRYIYDDGEISSTSPFSDVVLPVDTERIDGSVVQQGVGIPNKIKVKFQVGDIDNTFLSKVEILCKVGDVGSWFVCDIIEKDNLTSNSENEVNLSYPKLVKSVDQTDALKLYEYIPISCDSLFSFSNTRLGFSGMVEDYEPSEVNASFSIVKDDITLNTDSQDATHIEIVSQSVLSGPDGIDYTPNTEFANMDEGILDGLYRVYSYDAGDAFSVACLKVNIEAYDGSTHYSKKYRKISIPVYYNDDLASLEIRKNIARGLVLATDNFLRQESGANKYFAAIRKNDNTYFYVAPTEVDLWNGYFARVFSYSLLPKVQYYKSFKENTTHEFGICYFDKYNRVIQCNTDDSYTVRNDITINDVIDTNAKKLERSKVRASITSRPPVDAYSYSFLYKPKSSYIDFKQYFLRDIFYQIGSGYDNTLKLRFIRYAQDGNVRIKINAYQLDQGTNVGLYEFQEGQYLHIPLTCKTKDTGVASTVFSDLDFYKPTEYVYARIIGTSYDETIKDADGNEIKNSYTQEIVVEKFDISKILEKSDRNINESELNEAWVHSGIVEIVTPRTDEVVTFNEIGPRGLVGNPGASNRYHIARTVDDTNQSATDPIGTPLVAIIDQGDVVIRNALRGINIAPITSNKFSDSWDSDFSYYGKTLVDVEGSGNNIPKIRWSRKYFEGTNINGLSSVDFDAQVDYSSKWGDSVKLLEIGQTLKHIQEFKEISYYIGRQSYVDGAGNVELSSGNVVLSDANTYKTQYGSDYPLSIIERQGSLYYVDGTNGVVVKSQQGGQEIISDIGMRSYFRDKLENIRSNSNHHTSDVQASFNEKYNELVILIKDRDETGNISGIEALIFSERSKRWTTFSTYTDGQPNGQADLVAWTYNRLYSWQGNQLWRHDLNDTRNNFYGTQFESELEYISNDNPLAVKDYRSMSLSTNKLWGVEYITTPSNVTNPNGQKTFISKSRFKRGKEGVLYADIPRNILTPNGAERKIRLTTGTPIKGQSADIKITNDDTSEVVLFGATVEYEPSMFT